MLQEFYAFTSESRVCASVQFDAAARAANDRRQGRRRALLHLETKSKSGEHRLDTFGVGMFSNQIEERGS